MAYIAYCCAPRAFILVASTLMINKLLFLKFLLSCIPIGIKENDSYSIV